jgi:hypothetical protein
MYKPTFASRISGIATLALAALPMAALSTAAQAAPQAAPLATPATASQGLDHLTSQGEPALPRAYAVR